MTDLVTELAIDHDQAQLAVRVTAFWTNVARGEQDLAAEYGISDAHVSNIVNGLARVDAGGPIAPERRYLRRA